MLPRHIETMERTALFCCSLKLSNLCLGVVKQTSTVWVWLYMVVVPIIVSYRLVTSADIITKSITREKVHYYDISTIRSPLCCQTF